MNRLKRLFKTAFITDRLKRLYRLSTRYPDVKNAKKKSRVGTVMNTYKSLKINPIDKIIY